MVSLFIQETLKSQGFSLKEIRVYTSLLSSGASSAYTIAHQTGLKKPTTYVVLESLVAKGLVRVVPRSRKKIYEAQSPHVLEQKLLYSLKQMQSVLPHLLALVSARSNSPNILFFEGIEGMRQSYLYRQSELADTEFVGFYGSAKYLDSSLEKIFYDWNDENARLRIVSRTFVPDDTSLEDFRRHDVQHLRTVKKMPTSEYSSAISVEITKFFVRISLYNTPEKQSIIIDSQSVALTFRQIFEMLWSALPQKTSGYGSA